MKRLILMRHAKSDWSAGAAVTMTAPSIRAAAERRRRLGTGCGLTTCCRIRCSVHRPCGRVRRFVRLDLPRGIDVTFTRALYLATHDEILKAMRDATGDTVLMLGPQSRHRVLRACRSCSVPPDHPQFQQLSDRCDPGGRFRHRRLGRCGLGKSNRAALCGAARLVDVRG